MRRLDGQVEADRFEEDVFVKEDGVAPAPKVLCLFIDEQGWVLLRDAAAGDDDFFHLAACFFNFCREEDGCCGDFLPRVRIANKQKSKTGEKNSNNKFFVPKS